MGNVLRRYNGTNWEAVGGSITGDTLPIGSIIEFDGTDIPAGWEEVSGTNKIKKVSQVAGLVGGVSNEYSESTIDAYGCDYVNETFGGTELYYDENGTTGDVTLNDSAANYNCIEIHYKDNDGYKNSTKIEEPNGTTALLLSGSFAVNNCYIKGRNITISGTSIVTTGSSKNNYGQYTGVSSGYSNTNYIYIYKVIGYK